LTTNIKGKENENGTSNKEQLRAIFVGQLRCSLSAVGLGFSDAFRVDGHRRVVRQNDWGPTTGKHLKWIDGGDKKNRVDSETFEKLWAEQVSPLFAA